MQIPRPPTWSTNSEESWVRPQALYFLQLIVLHSQTWEEVTAGTPVASGPCFLISVCCSTFTFHSFHFKKYSIYKNCIYPS